MAELSTPQKLLLAQAVHDVGASDWKKVASLLENHPLWTERPNGFFSDNLCQDVYVELMREEGHDSCAYSDVIKQICLIFCSLDSLAGLDKPKARLHAKLARKWYMERVNELRTTILLEEEKFRMLAQEIEDIRAGKWDDRLGIKEEEPAAEEEEPMVEAPPPPPKTRGRKEPPPPIVPPPIDLEEEAAEEAEEEKPPTPKTRRPRRGRRSTENDAAPASAEEPSVVDAPEVTPVEETPAAAVEEEAEEEPAEETKASSRKRSKNSRTTKRKASETPLESPGPDSGRKRVKTEDGTPMNADDADERRWKKAAVGLIGTILAEPNAHLFEKPITKRDASAYEGVVLQPMCLAAVKSRIKNGEVRNINELRRDVLLIFANACVFNSPDSGYLEEARAVAVAAESHLDIYERAAQ